MVHGEHSDRDIGNATVLNETFRGVLSLNFTIRVKLPRSFNMFYTSVPAHFRPGLVNMCFC